MAEKAVNEPTEVDKALLTAASYGRFEVVMYLVGQGAQIETRDNDGQTALHFASHYGHIKAVQYLVDQGAQVDNPCNRGNTALIYASISGHLDVVNYLVGKGAKIEWSNMVGRRPLHLASEKGFFDVVQYLVSKGAQVESGDNTPFHLASFYGHLGVVKYLVGKGAQIDNTNKNNMTALHMSSRAGHIEVVDYLIGQGAQVEIENEIGMTSLNIASKEGFLDIVKCLVSQGALVERSDKFGFTALYWASANGHPDVVKYLLGQGAQVNSDGLDGSTPLLVASSHGHLGVVRYLVGQGAQVERRNNDGETPLIVASRNGHLDVVRYLQSEQDKKEEASPEEVRGAVCQLKEKKAAGEDNITAEMLKNMGEAGIMALTELCQHIYEQGIWPDDWTRSQLITIKKTTKAIRCEDHRTISLVSHASKVLLKVLYHRIEARSRDYIGIDQFGFRKGVGTREAIAVMRILSERCIQHDQDLYICFVDYEKAFDRVNWTRLMEVLSAIGVDWKDRRLIASLYMSQTASVRVGDGVSEPAVIGRGTRQGCLLSPLLFNIYAEAMVREALARLEEGVIVGGVLIRSVRYADDQATLAVTADGLQRQMIQMDQVVRSYGMRINEKKTKVMMISKGKTKEITIMINDNRLVQVNHFKYLGSMLTEDGKSAKEVNLRSALARAAFFQRQDILMCHNIDLSLRKRLVKSLVWSVLLYGAETWTLTKKDMQRLEAVEMWCWRKLLGVSWRDRVSNEEVLHRAQERRMLIQTIRERQKKWLGHIMRHDEGLMLRVIEGRIHGKKKRGRPRKGFLDDVITQCGATGYETMKRLAQDRGAWRETRRDT